MPRKLNTNFLAEIPEAAKFWHPTKNGSLDPSDVQPYSTRTVWWYCESCKEEWQDPVRSLHRGKDDVRGCPYCSNKRVSKRNSLATHYPNLSKEWHPERNGTLTPEQVVPGSAKKVWWICEKDHVWKEQIRVRCMGSVHLDVLGCPFCSSHRLTDDNNFGVRYPELLPEWHPTKNNISPYEVQPGSQKKVWWKCQRGHEWESTLHHRTTSGRNCPQCFLKTSFPEQAIFYYVKQVFPKAQNRYKEYEGLNSMELDIFLEDENVAIEFDGVFYHKDRIDDDMIKNELIQQTSLFLIRIREKGLNPLSNNIGETFYCEEGNRTELNACIERMFEVLSNRLGIDIYILTWIPKEIV